MSELSDYVLIHTVRGECRCGLCCDKGERPDPTGHTVDMIFFPVAATNDPDADELRRLAAEHSGEFGDVNLFDGKEHNYLELGGWLGDQGVALMFMGLASLVGLVDLLTPKTMLPDMPDDLVQKMAGAGMVSIKECAAIPVNALAPGE